MLIATTFFMILLIFIKITSNGIEDNISSGYLKKMGVLNLGLSGMVHIAGSYVKLLTTHF